MPLGPFPGPTRYTPPAQNEIICRLPLTFSCTTRTVRQVLRRRRLTTLTACEVFKRALQLGRPSLNARLRVYPIYCIAFFIVYDQYPRLLERR
jgi:hypothetical protein